MAGSLAHAPLYAKRTMLRMHAGLNRQLARCMRAAGGSDALRKGALGLRLSLSMFMLSCLQSCSCFMICPSASLMPRREFSFTKGGYRASSCLPPQARSMKCRASGDATRSPAPGSGFAILQAILQACASSMLGTMERPSAKQFRFEPRCLTHLCVHILVMLTVGTWQDSDIHRRDKSLPDSMHEILQGISALCRGRASPSAPHLRPCSHLPGAQTQRLTTCLHLFLMSAPPVSVHPTKLQPRRASIKNSLAAAVSVQLPRHAGAAASPGHT